jgi:membrane-anchored glycerophosphoryl diester phosphodiesterase (GDPDase)
MLEGTGIRESFKRSKKYVSGHWWQIFWRMFFIIFIQYLVIIILILLLSLLHIKGYALLVDAVIYGFFMIIGISMSIIYTYLLYAHTRAVFIAQRDSSTEGKIAVQ